MGNRGIETTLRYYLRSNGNDPRCSLFS
jgi:hypothetical protein